MTPQELSPTQQQIFALAVAGKQSKEIARELNRSVFTVKFHLQHVYAKLNVKSKAQLIKRYAQNSAKPDKVFWRLLTDQQQRCALYIADGLRNKEIAEQMKIQAQTVKVHVRNISAKLGVQGRHALLHKLFPRKVGVA